MKRASASDIRESLVVADAMARAGIRFVAMPVFDDSGHAALIVEMRQRLAKLEQLCEEADKCSTT